MTRSSSAVSALVLASLGAACIVSGGQPHPLYPNPEQRRPDSELARLFGPIGSVDGEDVRKLGKSFALLPGCHVVMLAEKTGEISTLGSGGYVTSLPEHAVWAFRMRGAHTYEIQVALDPATGPVGPLEIHAWDRDEKGGATEVPPIRNTLEVDECRKWAP
jgi:hypothetical protein